MRISGLKSGDEISAKLVAYVMLFLSLLSTAPLSVSNFLILDSNVKFKSNVNPYNIDKDSTFPSSTGFLGIVKMTVFLSCWVK